MGLALTARFSNRLPFRMGRAYLSEQKSRFLRGLGNMTMCVLLTIPFDPGRSTPNLTYLFEQRKYTNPDVFEPFRFYEMRTQDSTADTGKESIKHQMITPDSDYVFFGAGSQAWYVLTNGSLILSLTIRGTRSPGRFFAVNEMKTLFAHILLNYDVKLDSDTSCNGPPQPLWNGIMMSPDPKARVMFRKRRN
jgi:hypothetical protein